MRTALPVFMMLHAKIGNLTVSLKTRHYVRLFILHMKNDGCERTV